MLYNVYVYFIKKNASDLPNHIFLCSEATNASVKFSLLIYANGKIK
jgi:hypothetical protein